MWFDPVAMQFDLRQAFFRGPLRKAHEGACESVSAKLARDNAGNEESSPLARIPPVLC